VVILKKWWIIEVENVVDEVDFDQFDEIHPFITSMIKPRIPSTNEAPYLRNNHHEKVKNFKKPIPQWKVAKWLYKICLMCENMVICMKIWHSFDIRVKYAQCVKIWPFVWKSNFYLIFMWNMINVWKYDCFLKCVQFLKSYVQFLMDTILNLAIDQFLMKNKRDACYKDASPI
jgi:hypothetical protein